MQTSAQLILADLRTKRELRSPASHFRDYWRTYGLLILYGIAVPVLAVRMRGDADWLIGYVATITIILTAVRDSRRALDRRFEALVDLLTRKGVL